MGSRCRLTAALLAFALTGAGAVSARATPPPGETSRHAYRAAEGARAYRLHVPRTRDPRRARPLLVYLHGCTQTADDAALGSRFDQVAAQRGFLVVYPEQDPAANGSRCWNWFLPEHQHRDGGEPAILAGITREVMRRHRVDPRRVYVAGASAGADMATNLGASYPDLYAALGVISGCAYLTCADVNGAQAYAEMGPRARPMPVMIVQGSADVANNAAMGQGALRQWLGTGDLADNGVADRSVDVQPSHELVYGPRGTPNPPGDHCVDPDRRGLPCLGGALGLERYPYTVQRYDAANGRTLVEYWLIHGLNHAYPSGDPKGTFTDPLGPDVTNGLMDFLLVQSR